MGHLFHYPTASSPTVTLNLRPTLVTIQEDARIHPIQRVLETPGGVQWAFALSANRRRQYAVRVDRLQEADAVGFAGYTSLSTFFATSTLWMLRTFHLTHTDGGSPLTMRLLLDTWDFTEGLRGYWSGQFTLMRVP